jgi:CheY-like chemotaxis protein
MQVTSLLSRQGQDGHDHHEHEHVVLGLTGPGGHRQVDGGAEQVFMRGRERAAEAGCAEFIEKPVIPDTLIDVIRRVLGAAGTF